MRALLQSWLCLVVLGSLAAYSLITGWALDVIAKSSMFSAGYYLGNRPLPQITDLFVPLYFNDGHPFLTICLYPTCIVAAYFLYLMQSTPAAYERHARFALAALAAFVILSAFFVFAAMSVGLPFMPMDNGRLVLNRQTPPTPPLQKGIFFVFIFLLLLNLFLLIRMILSFRHRNT